MSILIREIRQEDDKKIEQVIRQCLIEYKANHEGTAWTDPYLSQLSKVYQSDTEKYWVAVDENKNVVAGVGIGKLQGEDGVCELQKMYCEKERRGKGIAQKLMDVALEHAKKFYKKCYLETLENMEEAQRLYKKNGFKRIEDSMGNTNHFECDVKFIRDL